MGGADYASIAPPHSCIDALKFRGPSSSHLADYLNALDKDDQVYAEFFEWKKLFVVEAAVSFKWPVMVFAICARNCIHQTNSGLKSRMLL